MSLLVDTGQDDTHGIVEEGLAVDTGDLGGVIVAFDGRGIVDPLGTEAGRQPGIFQRPQGLDVDGGADTACRYDGPAGFVDFDAGYAFRCNIGEVEGTAGTAVSGHLAAVECDEVEIRTEAADRDGGAFAPLAIDGNTGDPLQ